VHTETYWMCPRGCSKKKIKFCGKCLGCNENLSYYFLEKRTRKIEDLLVSDDEPDLWTCKKCNNHNIDLKKNCSKCGKNKFNQDSEENLLLKEKLKEWHWKCYVCKYTNKYSKSDQCYGCKKFTKQSSQAFEVEY
jgi:hypothetical protein